METTPPSFNNYEQNYAEGCNQDLDSFEKELEDALEDEGEEDKVTSIG